MLQYLPNNAFPDSTFYECRFSTLHIPALGVKCHHISHYELPAVPFTAPVNAAAGYCRFFLPPFLVLELLLELAALPLGLGVRWVAERLRPDGSGV
jgi:hypothetical protein